MISAVNQFRLQGAPIQCERFGNGHINETSLLVTDAPHLYILQKINGHVFRDVPALMRNISLVTSHLRKKDGNPRHVLTLVPTRDGADFIEEGGAYYRLYEYITDSLCLSRAETAEDFKQSGVAFGRFQTWLADFPAEMLSETIPRFHDTADRYALFEAALVADVAGRKKAAGPEIDFYLSRAKEAPRLMRKRAEGLLPLRVTHNDTKLNNVMLSRQTRSPLCVIDLDTVMPGLVANDFGDAIRFGASTAAEDETELARVSLSLELYEAFAKGFLSACGKSLTGAEIQSLPLGAKLMTLECGVRFLTDYLSGDTYFHTAHSEHNLNRCRTQMKLVQDMEAKWERMTDIVARVMERVAVCGACESSVSNHGRG